MWLGRKYGPNYKQHDLSRSGRLTEKVDLEPSSNFPNDLLRSTNSSFDACCEEKHGNGDLNAMSFLSQKLYLKNIVRKNGYFKVFVSGVQPLS